MANLKVKDGRVRYMMKTYDGTYVTGDMSEDEARLFLKDAKEDGSVVGYELVSGDYRFETEQIVLKLKSRKDPKKDDQ